MGINQGNHVAPEVELHLATTPQSADAAVETEKVKLFIAMVIEILILAGLCIWVHRMS